MHDSTSTIRYQHGVEVLLRQQRPNIVQNDLFLVFLKEKARTVVLSQRLLLWW